MDAKNEKQYDEWRKKIFDAAEAACKKRQLSQCGRELKLGRGVIANLSHRNGVSPQNLILIEGWLKKNGYLPVDIPPKKQDVNHQVAEDLRAIASVLESDVYTQEEKQMRLYSFCKFYFLHFKAAAKPSSGSIG